MFVLNRFSCPLFFIFLLTLSVTIFAQEIHVSPQGTDSGPGSQGQPLKSMEGAKQFIRKLKAEGKFTQNIQVIFHPGDYFISSPVHFGMADSGTEAHSITYRAAEGAAVNFIGSRQVSGFESIGNGIYRADVSGKDFEQLYVNGKRATRARTPNKGAFFEVKSVKETLFDGEEERVPAFAIQEITIDSLEASKLQLDTKPLKALAVFYHKWDNTRKYIQHYNPTSHQFWISGGGMKPWNPINEAARYYVENMKSALDAPGEWFLDPDGSLYYIPEEGETMETAEVFAPVTEQLLVISGNSQEEKVRNLHFEGLRFLYTGYRTPISGNEPAQAAAPIPAVVMVDWADRVHFRKFEIAHTGIGAIWLRNGVTNSILQQNYLHDLGAGGVKIGPLAAGNSEDLEQKLAGFNRVENNIIRDGGWVFPCAVGAMLFHAHDNELTHNEIANFRYSGVSVGWVWGYDQSFSKRNSIKFNHIHHLGWGDLSDMGGVYTLGKSEGTEVSHNHIHHVYSMTYGGWGLYTDEGSTGILMENNLVYACKNAGFHQHYGKENRIQNNIFAYNRLSQLQATRVEPHTSFTFKNNIILYKQGTLLSSNWDKINLISDHNLYWDERGREPKFGDMDWKEWQQKGNDRHGIIRNPGFRDAGNFDFSFVDLSAAEWIGFEPFDPNRAGVYGEDDWVRLAAFDPELKRKFDALVEELSKKETRD
ncbi:right-handed parallel beta-helix repeat-containing protein [Cyclobacterium salsum]|uniref:right-handed parallel beta-helix repeat-containing protein n=1 Tax=Cyclobacterium salsum TaxID=2666329 RepID=UPI0013914C70|nr:right-handed parallel beta-helix repeat-containing protein [Cyclobacterium salsum]